LQLREVGLALLDLLHVDLHAQAAEPERDLHVRSPVVLVVDVEALDPRHRLRHRRRVVEDAPHRRARGRERPLARDVHDSVTVTFAPSVPSSICQTRWYGLQLSLTSAPPFARSASWTAAQTAWIPAPPPSPMPFVPSGVNGDALST